MEAVLKKPYEIVIKSKDKIYKRTDLVRKAAVKLEIITPNI